MIKISFEYRLFYFNEFLFLIYTLLQTLLDTTKLKNPRNEAQYKKDNSLRPCSIIYYFRNLVFTDQF